MIDIKIKSKRKPKGLPQAGAEGTKVFRASPARSSGQRAKSVAMRARPGSFEWRYARITSGSKNVNTALYHAGSHYARLWERAGVADMGSPNLDASGGAGRLGVADRRCEAMDELRGAFKSLGMCSTARLTDYCVKGITTSEIAKKHGASERDMASVLQQDLRDCARHFKFL